MEPKLRKKEEEETSFVKSMELSPTSNGFHTASRVRGGPS